MKTDARISVVVPTYKEALNLKALCERLFAATEAAGLQAELIVVDDNSKDGTIELCDQLKTKYPVDLLVRTEERGLSSAVIAGLRRARNEYLVSMDADLQHPPESVPDMVKPLIENRADFVLGSRYVDQGKIVGSWNFFRKWNSLIAGAMAKPLTSLKDPMSGFFAIRRETFASAAPLNPIGYKIALELLVKTRCRRAVEVPIEFGQRLAGESKLSMKEQMRYVRHVLRLYGFKLTDRGR